MGYRKVDVNPFNSILSILFLVAIFVGLYYVATGIFTLLSWLAPVMFLGALLINYKVVLNYGKWLFHTLKTNFIMGLGAVLLMIFGYPIIAGYLLLKAIVSRKLEKVQRDFEERSRTQYAEYEEADIEVEYEDLSEDPPLNLNEARKSKSTRNIIEDDFSDYEDLFQ